MELFSVIIPFYNEESGLRETLTKALAVLQKIGKPFEVLAVDDGSTDASARIAKEVKGVQLLKHPYNKGYGAAVKTGLARAKYPWIAIVDADGSYDVDELPKLMASLEGNDMVVGSRTGRIMHEPLHRTLAKWFLRRLVFYLIERRIPDLNSGFRVFRKEHALKYRKILPSGFSLTTTLTLAFFTEGLNVAYVPINYHPRKGTSKIRPLQDGANFVALIFRAVTYFKPLKIFLPLAGFLFLAALAVAAYSTAFLGRLMDVTTVLLFLTSLQIASIGLLADLIVKKTEFRG